MTEKRGLFIDFEGGDGSGKGTQSKLLFERAQKEGIEVAHFSFPRYDELSARYVTRYLNGEYGAANEVHPDLASLPYVLDRVVAASSIRDFLDGTSSSLSLTPRLVITDRYVESNSAHQGTKIDSYEDRVRFYKEMRELEYDILGLPKPDMTFTLTVSSDIAQSNVDKKGERSYTTRKRDIHEEDSAHLDKASRNYLEIAQIYPDEHTIVQCMDKRSMRSIDDIHEELWSAVCKLIDGHRF